MDRVRRLRDRIEFYTITTVKDDGGGRPVATEVLSFATFCNVEAQKSRMVEEAGKMVWIQPYQVLIRHSIDHTPVANMIVKYKNGTYLIKGIEPVDNISRMVKLLIVRE